MEIDEFPGTKDIEVYGEKAEGHWDRRSDMIVLDSRVGSKGHMNSKYLPGLPV